MKRLFFLILAVCLTVSCASVEDGPATSLEFAAGYGDTVVMSGYGETVNIKFRSSRDWHIDVSGGEGWLEVSPTEGSAGLSMLKLKAEKNESSGKRTAVITVISGEESLSLTVGQDVYSPTLALHGKRREVSGFGGRIRVRVNSDVEYEYEIGADWIAEAETKAVRKYEHMFVAEPNTSDTPRTAEIIFKSDGLTEIFTVTQRPSLTTGKDWIHEDFKQRSLAMRFTADWCGYCPMMAKALDAAHESLDGRLEVVSLHGSQSALEFQAVNPLLNRFQVPGFPTGVVDARASIPNYSNISDTQRTAVDVAMETWEAYPAKTGIEMFSAIYDSELVLDLAVYAKEADVYKLTILLLEDNITGFQNGAGNNYVHNGVARVAVTSVGGETLRISEDGAVWRESYYVDVPDGCDTSNLRVLVYVEKPYGDQEQVYGVDWAEYGDYGDTYVDNCRTAPVGTEATLEFV